MEASELKEYCERNNITIKDYIVSKLDEVIFNLQKIRDKIDKGEPTENQDWINVSVPFHNVIESISNSLYLPKNER